MKTGGKSVLATSRGAVQSRLHVSSISPSGGRDRGFAPGRVVCALSGRRRKPRCAIAAAGEILRIQGSTPAGRALLRVSRRQETEGRAPTGFGRHPDQGRQERGGGHSRSSRE